ncbi:MAG: pyruvate, water dikinase regulatory protein [bacterium]
MKKEEIYLVSDATGETAEKIVLSVLAQFRKDSVDIQKFIKVTTPEQIKEIMKKASHTGAMVVYTLAQRWMRELMFREAEANKVFTIDLLGPVISRFSQYLSIKPYEKPGAQHAIDADYFRKIDAMEFTVKHDDGQNPETLYDADIVIIGVSRTSKTPLSIYLSHEAWKVANIPYVTGIDYNLDFSKLHGKLIGLVIDPVYLVDIRKERLKLMGSGIGETDYINLKAVYEEVNSSVDFFKRKRIPTVDVTKKSIEETASEILKTLKKDKIKF